VHLHNHCCHGKVIRIEYYEYVCILVLVVGHANRISTQEFCSVGVQQIQLMTEDRENGDLGVVAP